MRRAFLLLFLFPLAFPAVAASGDEDLRALQQRLAETLEANRIPGAGIALVRGGRIEWAGGIGYADYDAEGEGRHALGTTKFRIGSVTKIVTSLAVLQLVDQGRLSLDQSVKALAPELPITNSWEATDPVRVAHLLEHTAGFDDMHFRNMSTDESLPDSLLPVLQSLEDELEVRWRPGVKHAYSNPGYAVAGYLVEKISGRPFHDYVDENILAPLGMRNASWGVSAGNPHAAQGYTGGGRKLHPVKPRAIRLYPAGELAASSSEMARLVQLLLQRGVMNDTRIVSDDSIVRMETPRTTRAARHGLANGYGLGNYVSFRNGFRMHGHNGGLNGFMAELAYSPEHDFGYVVMINRADPAALRTLSEIVVGFLGADAIAPEPGARDVVHAKLPEHIEGCYRMTNPRNELLHGLEWLVQVMCVEIEEGRAILRHPLLPQVTALSAVDEKRVRAPGEAWPIAIFMRDEGLRDALEWAWIYFERSHRLAVVLPLILAGICMLFMLLSVLALPVWAYRRWRGYPGSTSGLSMRAWPAIATVFLAITLFAATRLDLALLDNANIVSMTVFLAGIAFVLSSLFALYRVVACWKAEVHPFTRWHSLLAALACTITALYLVYWQLVPLRTWTW